MERRGFVLAALVTVCLILFVAAPYVQAGGWQPWQRLEGAWLRTTLDSDEEGNPIPGVSAIYEMSPTGPFARKAGLRFTFINPDPAIIASFAPGGGYVTDGVGEAVMTGPSTYKGTVYFYIMANQPDGARAEVAAILVGTSTATISEGLIEGTQTGEFYLRSQDTDGDLIPDPGMTPVFAITQPFTDTRTPLVP